MSPSLQNVGVKCENIRPSIWVITSYIALALGWIFPEALQADFFK